jgi:hypothetical protein
MSAEILRDDVHHQRVVVGRVERDLAGDRFVQDQAEGPHVASRVDVEIAARLLGAHVRGRAEHGALHRLHELAARGADRLGDAEVEDLGHHVAAVVEGEEDVPGLEIAVDDAAVVRLVEAARDERDPRGGLARAEAALALEAVVHALAFEHLHHDVGRAVVGLTHVVDVDDGGVLELAARLRFVEEALQGLVVRREALEQELHREVAIRQLVARGPDGPHPTGAEQPEEPVLAGNEVAGVHVVRFPKRLFTESAKAGTRSMRGRAIAGSP